MIKQTVFVVYLLIPTSNHNRFRPRVVASSVVYLLIPTSNHNDDGMMKSDLTLFIS